MREPASPAHETAYQSAAATFGPSFTLRKFLIRAFPKAVCMQSNDKNEMT